LIVPFVVTFLGVLYSSKDDGPQNFSIVSGLVGILVISIYALPLAYLGELLLGMPSWLLFKHYGVRSYLAFAAGGAFLGLLFYLGLEASAGNFRSYSLAHELNPITSPYFDVDVTSGMAAAIVFRAVVFPRQRQEDENPHPGAPNE
jgi:hypothetical protein